MVTFTSDVEDTKRLCFVSEERDGVAFILVFKLSRFGRNAADVLNSLQFIQDYGVNLICVEDGIDSSNRKRVRILYPLPGGIALDFCKAGGFVDSLLFKLGSVAVIFEIVYLAVQMGENWKLFRM